MHIAHIDFEFHAPPGERPRPLCLVVRRHGEGRSEKFWIADGAPKDPPFDIENTIMCAYYASAELSCFSALGWPYPKHILDLFAEFRVRTNGTSTGRGLVDALRYFGLPAIDATEKDAFRGLAIRGGPYTGEEERALMAYCEGDVIALERLFEAMRDEIDWPRALHRGNYVKTLAKMEHRGVPVDSELVSRFSDRWDDLRREMIAEVDREYSVYHGTIFKQDRFVDYLEANRMQWPFLDDGAPRLDKDTFRSMSKIYPQITKLAQVRKTVGKLRAFSLSVGADGRNRCLLSPFQSKTGRNQPSNSRFVFGLSRWLRGLVTAPPGYGLLQCDWSQQEHAIAGSLSGDHRLIQSYASGDPYLEFAKLGGLVPEGATKATHPTERDLAKLCVLATQYGQGAEALALRIGRPVPYAEDLLRRHREVYRDFWQWSERVQDSAVLSGRIRAVHGWSMQVDGSERWRTLSNWPMQSTGSEMLRAACVLLDREGIELIAPIHDAVLAQVPIGDLEDAISTVQRVMADASEAVLPGMRLRSDPWAVQPGERLLDPAGRELWELSTKILRGLHIEGEAAE